MTCEFCFANVAVSVVTIAVSGLVGFLSAHHISTLNTRRQACAAFRAATAPVCVELRKENKKSSSDLDLVLSKTVLDVAIAFEIFYPFVAGRDRTAYVAAWRAYQEAAELGSEFIYKVNGVVEIKNRVEKLLSYARWHTQ